MENLIKDNTTRLYLKNLDVLSILHKMVQGKEPSLFGMVIMVIIKHSELSKMEVTTF